MSTLKKVLLKGNKGIFIILSSILLLAAFLRLAFLVSVPSTFSASEIGVGLFLQNFGMGEVAIRIPGVFVSLLTIVLFYFLTKEFLKKIGFKNPHYSLIGAFYLAISSWDIQISRSDFWTNINILMVVLLFFIFLRTGKKGRILASIVLVVFVLFLNLKSPDSSFQYKLDEIVKVSSDRIAYSSNSTLSKVLYNPQIADFRFYIANAFEYFDPRRVLFLWDANLGRIADQAGLINVVEFGVAIIGALAILRRKSNYFFLLLSFIFITIIPLAVSVSSPDAYSLSLVLPAIALFATVGIVEFLKRGKNIKILGLAFWLIFFLYFLNNYFNVFSKTAGLENEYIKEFKRLREEKITTKIVVVDKSYGQNMNLYAKYYLPKNYKYSVVFKDPKHEKNTLYIVPAKITKKELILRREIFSK